MAIATVPPGRCSTAHYHVNCESALYVAAGKGAFLSGEQLEIENEISFGDFIYVPPGANHQPVNYSKTEDLVLIVARNAPVEIVVELETNLNLSEEIIRHLVVKSEDTTIVRKNKKKAPTGPR